MNMLQQIRWEQKRKYELSKKYKDLLELDDIKRSVYKIHRFINRHILYECDNITKEQSDSISGMYKIRFKLNDSNLTIDKPKPIDKTEKTLQMVLDASEKEYFDKINRDFIDIYEEDSEIKDIDNDIVEYVKNISAKDSLISVCLDLRTYSKDPMQPIYVNDIIYYLNKKQQLRLKEMWNKVDPETVKGLQFKQDLDYYKTVSYELNKLK